MNDKKMDITFNQEGFRSRLNLIIGDESSRSYAQRAGISDTVLRSYSTGSVPSIEKAIAICAAARVASEVSPADFFAWFCLGVGPQPEFLHEKIADLSASHHLQIQNDTREDEDPYVLINAYDIYASAGHGNDIDHHEERKEPVPFRKSWIQQLGYNPERLAIIYASGDSMEPTISDNDVILILLSNGEAPRDGLHVLRLGDGLFVKRLQFDPLGIIHISSDNPAYKSTSISKEDREQLHIIGRVIWIGKNI
jgi:phage repressor protein C with HTH and peptisase S24 domain